MAASAAPLIQYLASAHLPAGARPFGVPFAGQFAEGQVLEQRVQLTVGKCYTVVAAGTPPVQELRVALFAVPGSASGSAGGAQNSSGAVGGANSSSVSLLATLAGPPLAEDSDSGPQAVLGRKAGCFKPLETQTQLLLVIEVQKGNGVAAAQVFEK
jgi:hypothetical protein